MIMTTAKIDGMMCSMCESHVNDMIRKNFKVRKVTSSHRKNEAYIVSEEPLTKEQLDKVKGNVYLICFDNKNPDWFLKCEYEKTYGFHFLYYDFSIYRIYNVQ